MSYKAREEFLKDWPIGTILIHKNSKTRSGEPYEGRVVQCDYRLGQLDVKIELTNTRSDYNPPLWIYSSLIGKHWEKLEPED